MTRRLTSRASPTRQDIPALGGFLALSAAVAGVSAVITVRSVTTWYPTLAKPPFNPPNQVFGPVWTVLYIAMAIAAWRIWRDRGRARVAGALTLYAAQMALNFAWSLIFFGLHRVGAALIDILGLTTVLTVTVVVFWKRDKLAGLLMVPYLAWVLFAALLNFAVWRLN